GYLLANLASMFQYDSLTTSFSGFNRTEKAGCAAAYDDYICLHVESLPLRRIAFASKVIKKLDSALPPDVRRWLRPAVKFPPFAFGLCPWCCLWPRNPK